MLIIPQPYLKWLFDYDKKTGKLYWKNHWNKIAASRVIGKEVGTQDADGYIQIRIAGKGYFAHKIIYYMEKSIYPRMLDHINGDRKDNRLENLREVNHRQNSQNKIRHRNGRLVGAYFHKQHKLWTSKIFINKKSIHLGYFNTELEAHQRYVQELQIRGLSLPKAEMQEINDMIKQDLGEV